MSKPTAAERAASDAYRKAVDDRRLGDVWADVVSAVSPLIEAAVREQIAQEIADLRDAYLASPELGAAWIAGWHSATDNHAARVGIARGEQQ